MLNYSFENKGEECLYEFLYDRIKEDISNGNLASGERLPSKRNLAKQLGISVITVENAYSLLLTEGYIYSVPKSGFFVSKVKPQQAKEVHFTNVSKNEIKPDKFFADFSSNRTSVQDFPFSIWARLVRENLSNNREALLDRPPAQGTAELREAIAGWLLRFRSMEVNPENIIIGAGTEYLYDLLIKILGKENTIAVEDPGYIKISQIYDTNGVNVKHIGMDREGIDIDELEKSKANVLHISPAHHFPSGIITSIGRRQNLLEWASQEIDRYIIEDDYDSEFRMSGKPVATLYEMDNSNKVVYINTFSKSLASTIRISYMVLPQHLMDRFREKLGFYSCTVSTIEQYTLADFIKKGYFEKHINRMRTRYRAQRNAILKAIKDKGESKGEIKEEHAGLHFLFEAKTHKSDEKLIEDAGKNGIKISMLSSFYEKKISESEHIILICYSDITPEKIDEAIDRLFKCF